MNAPIIMGITSGAAFLLGFLLLANLRKVNAIANSYLGLFIITLGLAMIEIPLFYTNFHLKHSNLFEAISLSRFLTAPFLYISIRYFTSFSKKIHLKDVLHFLPFICFLIFRIPFFVTGKNIEFNEQERKIVFFVLRNALPLQIALYWVLSFATLQTHLKSIKQFSSSIEKNDLLWLKHFLLILLVIIFAWFNLLFFELGNLIDLTPYLYLSSIFFLPIFPYNNVKFLILAQLN